ncbi:calcium-transporting ATPase 8, plasma membrane-type [Selaginella moellendorffii]|uniref:calcium-transporting ATPase 8, plasma membrane-type n=1 Tax=Selaginella moellendorffii TaxID=88036 RepID=UPI000D1C6F47|nr:calcium-transporting ATPase 8, plasma membrane-type [Selaginella moellendorffii]|eukprot:XP_024533916.1 calcium-transporting ATPase 8, plasma membrane-type [Selaginella moellendorffii]
MSLFHPRSPLRSQRLEESNKNVDLGDPEVEEEDDSDDDGDVFNIPHKKPSLEALKRWRKATLVLNASRRFRYTLDLKRQEQLPSVNRFRIGTHALRAVQKFKDAATKVDHPPPKGYGVGPEKLVQLVQDRDNDGLQALGGITGLGTALHVNLEKGIEPDEESVQHRREAFGANSYPTKAGKSFWVFVWEAAQDTTLIILMACAVASLAAEMSSDVKEGWYDGASIGFAVLVVIFVTAFSDYRQSLQFRSLSQEKRNIQIQVVRGGRRFTTSIFDLVVGDIVPLNIGDQVPADGVLVSGHSLSIDESSMTGESEPVHVDGKSPFLHSGCKVVDGYGSMLITGVGINTEWGQVMATLDDDSSEETPLQVRLNGIATFVGKIGLSVAVLVFVMLFVRYFVTDFRRAAGPDRRSKVVFRNIVDILSIAVTIVVVAVPEGLPLAVTLTLAYSMKKMMADKSLVRHLAACETMGSATTICSDKTGTLTLNQMTVVQTWIGGGSLEAEAANSVGGEISKCIIEGIAENSSGSVFVPKDGGDPEVTGSPTEKAILGWGLKAGMNFEEVRSSNTVMHVETFNSTKKRAGVAFKRKDGNAYVHWKGAAEIILDLCTKWMGSDGSENQLSETKKVEIQNAIGDMASRSLRCVALAYRPISANQIPDESEWESWKIPEDDLVLLGIMGIKDPCRPGVDGAVRLCQKAGVKVRMVTGDNPLTARAIAQECGILSPGGLVVEGKDFRSYTDEERLELVPKLEVMARSSPMDKLLLVKTLRSMNDVVAVTGDGTNDAPALHEADIGLSMGIQGTEVAKESSDIIILDDNFASVVKVVRWGRSVYANIQKFIQFQLTVNVVALVLNVVAAAKSSQVPLTAVQLLWVNLIMDTLGALALATEPPTDDLMDRPPVGRREPLVTNIMWRNIFVQAIYQLSVLFTLFFGGLKILKLHGPDGNRKLNTIIFNSFVLCQLFNEVNSRKPDKLNVFSGFFRNPLFCGVVSVTAVLQVIIVFFLGKFFKTTRLGWNHWVLSIVVGFLSLVVGFFGKLIPVPKKPIITTHKVKKKRARSSKGSKKPHDQEDGHELVERNASNEV